MIIYMEFPVVYSSVVSSSSSSSSSSMCVSVCMCVCVKCVYRVSYVWVDSIPYYSFFTSVNKLENCQINQIVACFCR